MFNFLLMTHKRVVPSFLVTRTTGLDQLLWHGSITPRSSIVCTSSCSISCLAIGNHRGGKRTGLWSPVSMVCLTRPVLPISVGRLLKTSRNRRSLQLTSPAVAGSGHQLLLPSGAAHTRAGRASICVGRNVARPWRVLSGRYFTRPSLSQPSSSGSSLSSTYQGVAGSRPSTLSHLVITVLSPIQVPQYRVRGSSVRFMTGITVSDWSGFFNADPIAIPSSAYRHWLEQGWATAAFLGNKLEAYVGLHGTITSVLAGNYACRAIFKPSLFDLIVP